jgi:hypothetical protein
MKTKNLIGAMVLVAILMPAFSFAEDCRGKSSDN